MASNLEAKAREIVETWSDFMGGSFSGSDLWDLSKKISAALREERERAEQMVIAVMDECSDRMHKAFEDGRDEFAEAYRLRHEGAARVAQKLGMLTPVDDAAAIRGDSNGDVES